MVRDSGIRGIWATWSKLSKSVVGLTLLLVIVAFGAGMYAYFPTASNQGYSPEQPIPFSHKIHAGDNKIACLYCHSNAERSRHATVPGVGVCMNCHSVVKTDSPWIQKVKAAYDAKQPIEWVRVHELPDYVYFNHKRHLAKGVKCENCHGDVQAMDQVYQASALTMGWCMECHRGETTPREVLKQVAASQGSSFKPDRAGHLPVAPVQCNTCHN